MSPPPEQELIQHARSLRGLALALVGPAHADDLVQDATVEALARPPREPGAVRSWLSTVMRNLARKRHRGERRRASRELRASEPPQAVGSPFDVAEQREAIAGLHEALLALPERYHAVLLLRYFEELTPTEIAARTGEPLATVKSRLRRGLELLRERLDARRGDWRGGLALAFGFGSQPTRVAASWAGILIMGTMGKIVVAATAAVLIAWWALGVSAPFAPGSTSVASGDVEAGQRVSIAAGGEVESAPVRTDATASMPAPGSPTTTSGVTYAGRCVDELGNPLAGVEVTGTVTSASGRGVAQTRTLVTGLDGTFELQLAVRERHNHMLVLVHAERCEVDGSFFKTRESSRVELGDVAMPIACQLTGRVIDAGGAPQAGVELYVERLPSAEPAPALAPRTRFRAETTGDDGTFTFAGQLRAGAYQVLLGNRKTGNGRDVGFEVPFAQRSWHVEVVAAAPPPRCRGVVVDGAGVPIAGASVSVDGGRRTTDTETDAQGRFALWPDPNRNPGSEATDYEVRVHARGYLDARAAWDLASPEPLQVVLEAMPTLRLRVVDAETQRPVEQFVAWRLSRSVHPNVPTVRDPEHPGGVVDVPSKAGAYHVVVDAVDDCYATSAMTPVEVPKGAVGEVTVALTVARQRQLVLRAGGAPVVGAVVELVDCGGAPIDRRTEVWPLGECRVYTSRIGCLLQKGNTDERGSLLLQGPVGTLALRISGGGLATQFVQDVDLDRADDLVLDVERAGVLLGRLQPADVVRRLWQRRQQRLDEPIVRDGLVLRRPDGGWFRPISSDSLPFAEDGTFRIDGIPAGEWQLFVSSGVWFAAGTFAIEPGQQLEREFDVGALRKREVAFRVLLDGAPAAERSLHGFGRHASDARGERLQSRPRAVTDVAGRATLATFVGDVWWLVPTTDTNGKPLQIAAHMAVPQTAGGELLVDARTGSIAVALTGPDGQPAAGAVLALRAAPCLPWSEFVADGSGRIEMTLAAVAHEVRVVPRSERGAEGREHTWLSLPPLAVVAGANATQRRTLPQGWSR